MCYLQYASDVSSSVSYGTRDTYAKCQRTRKSIKIKKRNPEKYVMMLPVCVGNNVKGIFNILKRRHRGNPFRPIKREYALYKTIKRDIERYKSYENEILHVFNSIVDHMDNFLDDACHIISLLHGIGDYPEYDNMWCGSIHGYLTPFECRAIASCLKYPLDYGGLGFVISKRVFKFICKCRPDVNDMVYWFVPI